ncbi:MAG: FeoB-associated Cys-rich membrane protein [Clostridia bacterium]|nr:FeoB-associated Cys-rich membrane protein [Clostridia bacterium]
MGNLSTAIVAAIVAAVFVAIVVSEIKKRRSGKGSCSCGCSGCALQGKCSGTEEIRGNK